MTRRIAMISEHASPLGALGGVDAGGQNVYVGQLASHLAGRGFEVDVFTRRDSPNLPEVFDCEDGVRVVHVPAGPACFVPKEDMLPYMGDFTTYMQKMWSRLGGYDLIHANFWMSGLVAADLKQALGSPFVITFHALGKVRRLYQAHDGFPEARLDIEGRIVREADQVIAECLQDRDDLIEYYAADSSLISVIPCGVDTTELQPMDRADARRQAGLPEDEPLILQLGRLVPRKGIETVIRAVAKLHRTRSLTSRLMIVGGESDEPDPEKTPEIGRLLRIARDEGIEDLVTFAGRKPRAALKTYYGAADVFVTTPWYEPFGMTPLEAMACARPVVGSCVGGLKYSITDGETGHLVPPNDPDALTGRLEALLRNPRSAELMGIRGRERVLASFTWPCVAEQVGELYGHVLARRPAAIPDRDIHTARSNFDGAIEALARSRDRLGPSIIDAASAINGTFRRGGKLLICGNGGSAADAQHFAAELVGRFQVAGRPALPALALTADTTVLTAWANDVGFDDVFKRQLDAFGMAGDVLVAISTSGESANVLNAVRAARECGITTVALTGRGGGQLAPLADFAIVVPSDNTQHVQEVHSVVIHLICELVEEHLWEDRTPISTVPTPQSSRSRRSVHAA